MGSLNKIAFPVRFTNCRSDPQMSIRVAQCLFVSAGVQHQTYIIGHVIFRCLTSADLSLRESSDSAVRLYLNFGSGRLYMYPVTNISGQADCHSSILLRFVLSVENIRLHICNLLYKIKCLP